MGHDKRAARGTGAMIIKSGLAIILAVLTTAFAGCAPDVGGKADVDQAAKRGSMVYGSMCQSCHGIRVIGAKATFSEARLRSRFGTLPPDLSQITRARGKGAQGEKYVSDLLTGYVPTNAKNKVLPNIAMPDPGVNEEMADDVALFLAQVADPNKEQRHRTGYAVIGFTLVLALLIYLVKRDLWRDISRG